MHDKRKIAFYLPSLRGGGAERVMVTLANGFVAAGLDADLVLAKAEGPYLSDLSPAVRTIDLDRSGVLMSLPGLVRYLRKTRPSAVLSTMGHANLVAIWARSLAGMSKQTKLVVREAATISMNYRYSKQTIGRLLPQLIKLFYPKADEIVTNSHDSAKDLSLHTGISLARIHVIFNPLDLARIRKKASVPVNHPWFNSSHIRVIISAGRLAKQKDFATLIRAFHLVYKEEPFARLIILGEGEDRQKLERLIRQLGLTEKADLPGFIENPYSCLNQADLFVLSSRWEGLPNALIEALAVGTPVISTDCRSGPAEILENGKWGRLVPVADTTALARAILETLHNPPDREALKKRAGDFAMDKIVKQYMALLYGYWRDNSGNS